MKLKLQKQEKGFTIIEVLIVLAIAGLIVLIVFLAVPALQRNSRNTQRKNDVSALLGAYSEAVNNNNGAVPASCTGAATGCWVKNAKLSNYDNNTATVAFTKNTSATSLANPDNLDNVTILSFSKCDGSSGDAVNTNATARSVVALYTVETQGGKSKQCQEV